MRSERPRLGASSDTILFAHAALWAFDMIPNSTLVSGKLCQHLRVGEGVRHDTEGASTHNQSLTC
jgi:hypothetical protein